jgi:hypothetical protein
VVVFTFNVVVKANGCEPDSTSGEASELLASTLELSNPSVGLATAELVTIVLTADANTQARTPITLIQLRIEPPH